MITRHRINNIKENNNQSFTSHFTDLFLYFEFFVFEWNNKITKRDVISCYELDTIVTKMIKEEQ